MTATVLSSIPASSASGQIVQAVFEQATAPGPVSIPGLKAGDVMIALADTTNNNSEIGNNLYEGIVSADDQLVQKQSTTTPHQMSALFYRILS